MNDQDSGRGKNTERLRGSASPERGVPDRRRRRQRPPPPEASVNMDELRELIALIRENGFAEFELEREGFRVRLRREVESIDSEVAAGDQGATIAGASSVPALNNASAPGVSGESQALQARSATATAPSHPGAGAETAASEDQNLYIIPSPIVGTFYRTPSPDAESFVKIGSQVEPDTVVCIIEAMKLMNEIQAETAGEVVKIYVENGQPVEYGQPLFGIKK